MPCSTTLCALCLPVILLVACAPDAAPPPAPAALVRTVVVGAAAAAETTLTGVVAARTESALGFRVGGKIAARLVDPGARVRRGQPLLRLDPTDLALAATGAAERLRAAEADAARAAADERRLSGLVAGGAISASAYDTAVAAARATAATLAAVRSAAREAGNQRRYATLAADTNGIVTEVMAQPGQVVAAGTPVVRLAAAGAREAVVAVPETALAGLPRTARATMMGGATSAARLREVAGAADPATRTYAARYTLLGPAAAAPIGATVTLGLTRGGAGAGGAVLPLGALYDGGRGPGVWVVRRGRVALRPVRVVALSEESAELAAGALRPGERVVALGVQLLREGQAVRLAGGGA